MTYKDKLQKELKEANLQLKKLCYNYHEYDSTEINNLTDKITKLYIKINQEKQKHFPD